MVSTSTNEGCVTLRALTILGGTALCLAGCASAHAPSHGSACGQGTFVEAEQDAFCVYRLDSPLVIEGGFQCPASFEFKIELTHSIACSERELPRGELPLDLCREIGEDCTRVDLESDARIGGPGECVAMCDSDEDCAPEQIFEGSRDGDNYACIDGACRYTGCNDDDECAASIPEPATVCRADLREDVPYCRDACERREDCFGEGDTARLALVDCVEGACLDVGCTSDEQCPAPSQCIDTGRGYSDCYFKCETPQDCADAALEELGLDEPVATDPWNYASGFTCREGLCHGKPLGCDDDGDCDVGLRCKLRR